MQTTFPSPPTVEMAELVQNGHDIFRHYRAHTPFLEIKGGTYLAIRATDVEQLATDPRTRQVESELASIRGIRGGALFDFLKYNMLLSNGTEHRRRRSPISRAPAFRLIDELRTRIRAIAEELLEQAAPRKEMSLVEDYAAGIPTRVVGEILGIPPADIPELARQARTLARVFSSTLEPEDLPELETAAARLTSYVEGLLRVRHDEPRSDFLGVYAEEIARSKELSPIEAATQVVALIVAGSDSTRTAMAIQISLLLQHREQWDAVCRDASYIPGAVLESLRYEPALGSFPRFTREDVKIEGWIVPANRLLSLSTMSALRDPTVYSRPDSFDIMRTDHPRRHMVFGNGAHRCLGEGVARAELEESLAALARRFPQLQLAGAPPRVIGTGGIRMMNDLRVCWA